jgi:SAM-dependent methyltransferase
MATESADYEYRGLMAQAWDLLRGDTSQWPDHFFFLDVIRSAGQPVLDVGCGTGRLSIDYRSQGIDIDGVDNSPEMLALCRERACRLGLELNTYQQAVEQLDLPRRYRTILVPSSTLQLVIDPAQAIRAVQHLHAALEPGGTVVASFMVLWQPGQPITSEFEKTAVRPEDGATIRRRSRARYEAAIECEHTVDVYQVIRDGQVVQEERLSRSPATRSYTQDQARALFERGGFREIHLLRAFTFEPAGPQDTPFVVLARRGRR